MRRRQYPAPRGSVWKTCCHCGKLFNCKRGGIHDGVVWMCKPCFDHVWLRKEWPP